MSTQQLLEPVGLANLPCEIHLEILYLCSIGEALSFVTACDKIYNNLIVEFYKVYGPQLNWLPLLVGISEGNTRILDKCEKAGASLNHRWPYLGDFGGASDTKYFRPCQPLDLAAWSGQGEALQWLAERGAVATGQDGSSFILMTDAECFVSDLRTAEGNWKPIMYQQGLRFRENYPPNPSFHFVWHSSNIERTKIFPRLLQLYARYTYACLTNPTDRIGLANWVAWIWLDMLRSSSDPAPILKSGFFQEGSLCDEKPRLLGFDTDNFGQESLIHVVGRLTMLPFARHASLEIPGLISRLLDSGANIRFIASAYITMLDCMMRDESNGTNIFPTLDLYPLLIRTVANSVSDAERHSTSHLPHHFRLFILSRFRSSADHLEFQEHIEFLEGKASKMALDMIESGASPAEVMFAFDIDPEDTTQWVAYPISQAALRVLDGLGLVGHT
ncbi:hypothetical protein CEP51_014269 [Fusarium floridanum]|uniref:F-box domain-containing protein n=1 Tax=Fusarium floridanum TaxID=1325733 RepID=A0A428PW04_9HYPO|nr:hypothetical protein CEP51_014269 [Fusarium floridanum]